MEKLDLELLLKELTLEEKASLLCGYKNMLTRPIDRLNIPSIVMSDGPNGVRKEKEGANSLQGIAKINPTTCFPSGVNLGSSWDRDLVKRVGEAIGKECRYFSIDLLLGPAINIKRNPLCGRNFDYYSEDPLLTGYLASSFINGVQEQNVCAVIKHFACNNSENYRFTGDSVVDLRTLHEIYLKPFEIALKNSSPLGLMNAYNKVNQIHCSQNEYLLKTVLEDKWNYHGLIMTDWGGLVDRVEALKNGTDLEMPGMILHNINSIIDAVKNNILPIETVDQSVSKIINILNRREEYIKDDNIFKENENISLQASINSSVLLKNDNVLPLNKDKKYLVIGDFFNIVRYQGSGSSLINPLKLIQPKDAFDNHQIEYRYVRGYKESIEEDNLDINEVIDACKEYDEVLFFGGLTDYVESEGFDRDTLSLPENQLKILYKLFSLNKKVIFICFGGGVIHMPFVDKLAGLLNVGLGGQMVGEACYKLLFNEASPSGRLAQTWMKEYEDVPFFNEFNSSPVELYKESIYVGYRYYNSISKEVLFPFGYGLSYATFEYSNFKVDKKEDHLEVLCSIENTSSIDAYEVVQIYVGKEDSSTYRPNKELKQFDKVFIKAHEKIDVILKINFDDLKIYNPNENRWLLEDGNYRVYISKNVNEDYYQKMIKIKGEKVNISYHQDVIDFYFNPSKLNGVDKNVFDKLIGYISPVYEKSKKPYTMESIIAEFDSFFGKIFRKIAINLGMSQYRKALKMEDGPDKEREKKSGLFIAKLMPANCIRSLCHSSAGMLKYNIAQGLLHLVNGRYIKGIIQMLKKDK